MWYHGNGIDLGFINIYNHIPCSSYLEKSLAYDRTSKNLKFFSEKKFSYTYYTGNISIDMTFWKKFFTIIRIANIYDSYDCHYCLTVA